MIEIYKKVANNYIEWHRKDNNLLHREDGPAVEYADGTKQWCQNGKFHRIDGPAIECPNGTKAWYQNGKYHRTDGPAIEYWNGEKLYCLNGKHYPDIKTDEEWSIFQIIN